MDVFEAHPRHLIAPPVGVFEGHVGNLLGAAADFGKPQPVRIGRGRPDGNAKLGPIKPVPTMGDFGKAGKGSPKA